MRRPVGVKQIRCVSSETTVFLPPSGHCRHASIRTLEERFASLGACWAFSFQPVLPSDWRPVVSRKSETWARPFNAVTGTRLWAFVFVSLPGAILFYAAAATVMRLLLCNGSYTSPLTHR